MSPADPGWVQVEADVQQGKIGFNLLDRDRNVFVTRVSKDRTGGTVRIMLPLPVRKIPLSLAVENAADTPQLSKVVVRSMDVLMPKRL
jgi:hypothetical protein